MDQVESSDPPAEIIISTLPQTRSGWLRRDLVERVRDDTKLPGRARRGRRPEQPGGRRMTSIAAAHDMPGPGGSARMSRPTTRACCSRPCSWAWSCSSARRSCCSGRSSRPSSTSASATASIRSADFEIPKATTGINTAILVASSFTMHWALVSIRRGQRLRPDRRPRPDADHGPDVPGPADARVPRARLRALRRRLPDHVLRAHRPARHARVRGRDAAGDRLRARLPRATTRRTSTSASR